MCRGECPLVKQIAANGQRPPSRRKGHPKARGYQLERLALAAIRAPASRHGHPCPDDPLGGDRRDRRRALHPGRPGRDRLRRRGVLRRWRPGRDATVDQIATPDP
jgi:hypothetical protein